MRSCYEACIATDALTGILHGIAGITAKVAELSEQERSTLLASETFIDFFDRSTKVIERALTEDYDILVDYTATVEEDETKEANEIKRIRAFSSDKHTKNRALTDVDWSMQYPELVLGSYNKNAANINEPDGLVIVWNLHMSDRPEFVLQSQSDVMSAKFSPFHHHMVVGGTYSGQIVIWDVRAKNTPILKTSLSSPGHSHPVYSLAIIGTQNAHNLVSASTDGVVCTWQLDMIAQPQDVLELTHASNPRTDEVAVSCMAFHHNETSTFWVGTEEGNVYQANRFDSASSKAGIDPQAVYAGHNGMVTGIDFHSGAGSLDFQDLFLTSSVDWTVKLWKTQPAAKTAGMHAGGPVATCLHSFDEAEDYVFDVAWSPVHPAMFASVDGTGRFDLYNLAISEIPVASDTMPNRKALNKIAWDKEGRRVGLASSDGSLFVYDIGQVRQCLSFA
ncbi:WD40-repeat-containing domain protein [Entophlyctis helioformis]|nr:WD40-repeat-containing domain protein [Entophlyctis helioformis]